MKLYERPDFDRAFGGRPFDKTKHPFMYWYDVVICFVPDTVVDCLYTLNCFGELFAEAFNETYSALTDFDKHPFFAFFNQIGVRILGGWFTGEVVIHTLLLLKRLF